MLSIKSVKTRMATKQDKDLPTYDHTKLSAINTCPTWGILRYTHHKRMPGAFRAMALEAGSASHEGFAAVRWYQYRYFQCKTGKQISNAMYHGVKLFPNGRFEQMLGVIQETSTHRTNCINFTIEAVESSDFYDDPTDPRRTISNINEALIAYIDAYDFERYPVWVRDPTDPETDIGIEIAFEVVVDIEYTEGLKQGDVILTNDEHLSVRFTGKLDGLHIDPKRDNQLIIEENKTGARIDDAWLAQWILSHQITGYCIASSTFTELECKKALVRGMRLPIGKIPYEGIRKESVNRNEQLFQQWATWFLTSILTELEWKNDVVGAPMYTHSCNRYFRSCSFLPLCSADTKEEMQEIIDEMELDEWSPLHE